MHVCQAGCGLGVRGRRVSLQVWAWIGNNLSGAQRRIEIGDQTTIVFANSTLASGDSTQEGHFARGLVRLLFRFCYI
jgi:hypothetical protein